MAKEKIDVVFCDVKRCQKWWHPPKTKGWSCMVCHKDLCESHAYPLSNCFEARSIEKKSTLGYLCPGCHEALQPVLTGAEDVIAERLRGLIGDCVKTYAVRLKEEQGAKKS